MKNYDTKPKIKKEAHYTHEAHMMRLVCVCVCVCVYNLLIFTVAGKNLNKEVDRF